MPHAAQIGRIVHYKFPDNEGGMERPAMIVRVWREQGHRATAESAAQLQVFLDCDETGSHNDGYTLEQAGARPLAPIVWKTSVHQGHEPGQFHFYEECGDPD